MLTKVAAFDEEMAAFDEELAGCDGRMNAKQLTMVVVPGRYGICRLKPDEPVPAWGLQGEFFSVTRTSEELSIVCVEAQIPESALCERGWRLFKIDAVLDFSLVGIVAGLSAVLAGANIGIFVLSTYNTDYVLVRQPDFSVAVAALRAAGYEVSGA